MPVRRRRAGGRGRRRSPPAGAEGDAYTFITPEQEKYAGDIVKALEMSGVPVPEDLQKMADGTSRAHGRPADRQTSATAADGP